MDFKSGKQKIIYHELNYFPISSTLTSKILSVSISPAREAQVASECGQEVLERVRQGGGVSVSFRDVGVFSQVRRGVFAGGGGGR